MKKLLILMLMSMASLASAQNFGFITGSLTCKTNSSGNGLVVTAGRFCGVFGFGSGQNVCVDAATALNGFNLNNIANGNYNNITYSGLTAANLSANNIPCEVTVAAIDAFLTVTYCNQVKIVYGYGESLVAELTPTATISISNNTLYNQWTGACIGIN